MKKLFFTSMIFVFVIFSSVVKISFAQAAGPRISILQKSFDFGKVIQGKIVKHDFEISNAGDAPLKIIRLRSSCGCTVVKPSGNVIKPDGKITIHAEFNSGHYLGTVRKYVYLTSNDPNTPEVRLSLTGIVVKPLKGGEKVIEGPKLSLSQNRFNFGEVKEGKTVSTEIAFSNVGNKTLVIKDVETSCGCTAAILSSKILKPHGKGKIRIDLDTSNHLGKIVRTITIFSNDVVNPKQVITIFAIVK